MQMKNIFLAIAIALTTTVPAATASLVDLDPPTIRDHIAELTVASGFCGRDGLYSVRHNMLDQMWDVLELKTGAKANDDAQVFLFAQRVEGWEAAATKARLSFCIKAFTKYGPTGSAVPDAMYEQ